MNTHNFSILVVDDEPDYTNVLNQILTLDGYSVETAKSGEEALMRIQEKNFSLVLTDLMMDGMNGIELLEKLKEINNEIQVILITGFGTVKNAVTAMKKGAFSYFIKGNDPDELLLEIKKIYDIKKLKDENKNLKLSNNAFEISMTSKNPEFQKTINTAIRASKSNANILLLGESGVGKEIFARFIHASSDRSSKPFVAVNCHAFQESVLESELFGHSKGSFTGAFEDRIGRFEAADQGTLFLDEIADTPLTTQVKLLRSLENRVIERLGSNQTIPVDFRLITATNKNIQELIEDGDFREDFYYRISTIMIEIPPLRNRREDIEGLVEFFIKKSTLEMKKKITRIEDSVMEFLLNYDYPGNIRELKNIIERLVVLSENGIVKFEDISANSNLKSQKIQTLKEFRFEMESEYIKKILEQNEFNMTQSSKVLGISRRQLFNKINEYDLKSGK